MATDPIREQAAEMLTVMAERMHRYEQLLAELRDGRIEPRAFRRQAVSTGLIVETDGAWIFDLSKTRWMYYDGVELRETPDPPSRRRSRAKRS